LRKFDFHTTGMNGLKIIDTFVTDDTRGYFVKDFAKDIFLKNGLDIDFFECFETRSRKNVIRGLHFQLEEPQAKLVRAIMGSIFDVVVDLRADSPTFGQWAGFDLSDENKQSLYIPQGFAHGFCVRSEAAIVAYKCVGRYLPEADSGIIWNDPDLSISWGIDDPIISERDKALMTFSEFVRDYQSFALPLA
jgi:dTDP-4-dehydrorhamnose 3,5-epimerase